MIHRRRSTDHNQGEISKALQVCGYHVTDLAGVGNGCPDLLVTRAGRAYLIEIKNKAGRGQRFTPAQLAYYDAVHCPVFVFTGVDDVISWVNGLIEAVNTSNGRFNPKETRTVFD